MTHEPSEGDEPWFEEVFLGLSMAIGTDWGNLKAQLFECFECARYRVQEIHISDLLDDIPGVTLNAPIQSPVAYFRERMNAGDSARHRAYPEYGILAYLAIREIAKFRRELQRESRNREEFRGIVYLLDSLMHPEEVAVLRATYGTHFFLLGIYEDPEQRRSSLVDRLRPSMQGHPEPIHQVVDELIERSQGQDAPTFALSVENTFHLADVFIDTANPTSRVPVQFGDANGPPHEVALRAGLSESTLRRFIFLLFSARNLTPTKYEIAMSHAYAASSRSASLARRIGAVIVSAEEDLIASGYNEVPAPGGNLYPVQDGANGPILDHRDPYFRPRVPGVDPKSGDHGYDSNDLVRVDLLKNLLSVVKEVGLVDRTLDFATFFELLRTTDPDHRLRLLDVIEYGRAVHAEMAAILSATRRGQSVKGATLYCTTFPCHECARHIVAAGIDRVVYIEPYPKSRVAQLHPDSIALGQRGPDLDTTSRRPTEFVPFIGIAPARQHDLFSYLQRKRDFLESAEDPGRAFERSTLTSAFLYDAELRWSHRHRSIRETGPVQRKAAETYALSKVEGLLTLLERSESGDIGTV